MMQLIDALRTHPPGRKHVAAGVENHWWNQLAYVYARIPALLQMGGGGLQASPSYDFVFTMRDELAKLAYVFDAPYLVFDKGAARYLPIGEDVVHTENYLVRRLPSGGLVAAVEVADVLPESQRAAHRAALSWTKSSHQHRDRVLAYHGFGQPGEPPRGTVRRAWRQDSPGDLADLVAEVEVTAPTTFMFRESWHPRWHAFVDGLEVPVRRVTPSFPAVDVPRGSHTIQLRFERPWWAQAVWLAWPGAVVLAWLGRRRARS
jgi:hypothetical protein